MVLLLLDALVPDGALPLHNELMTAYILDDLERQAQRKDQQSRFFHVMARVRELASQGVISTTLPRNEHLVKEEKAGNVTYEPSQKVGEVEPLVALLTHLYQHPELIPVANDFVRELTPGE